MAGASQQFEEIFLYEVFNITKPLYLYVKDDWEYERGSNIYFLGDAIHLQASVTLANHLPLLLFVEQCVATPTPNVKMSDLQYSFVEFNG